MYSNPSMAFPRLPAKRANFENGPTGVSIARGQKRNQDCASRFEPATNAVVLLLLPLPAVLHNIPYYHTTLVP